MTSPKLSSSMNEVSILIVEGDPDHVAPVEAVFTREFPEAGIHVESTCPGAKNYLHGAVPSYEVHPLPTLIVLDLQLVDTSAIDLLEWMGRREWLAKIPVIVRTASTGPEDVLTAYELGATRVLHNPDDFGKLVEAVKEELRLPEVVSTTTAVTNEEALEITPLQ